MRYIYVYKLCDNLYSCMNKTVSLCIRMQMCSRSITKLNYRFTSSTATYVPIIYLPGASKVKRNVRENVCLDSTETMKISLRTRVKFKICTN